jgi:outer membrane autotransporter protein
LSVTTNFNAGQDGFIWNDGGSLAVSGDLTGLDTLNGTNKTLTIDAGTWDTGPTNLYITGVGNTLAVTNGGFVQNASAFIGVTSNDVDNTVRVEGAGSEWNLTEDLFINPNNTLALASTGLVSVAGHMSISNAAVVGSGQVIFTGAAGRLSIYGTGSRISTNVLFDGGGGGDTAVAVTDGELMVTGSLTNRFTGFESLNLTNSLLGGTGHVDAFGSIGMSGGRVSPDGELVIDSPFDASGTLLQLTAGADRLVFTNSAAPRDLSGLLAEVTVSDTNTFREVIVTSDSGFSAGFASTNFIEPFLLYNFMLTDDGTNVSVESETVQDGEIGATLAYGGIQGVRSGFNGMQNTLFVRTKQLRRNTVATDDAISNEAYLMSQTNAPSGPPGPGDKNTVFGMHFWAKQYSGQGDYDASGASDGFSLNNNGTTFGFDRLFGDALVAGINYTYARSAARTGDDDRIDTETYWLGLYGEWFSSSEYYLEGLIGCGWSDYDTRRNEAGYVGEGKFEGTDVGAHIEAGKYLHRGSWAMAPYAGLQYLAIESDAYTETERGSGADIKVNGQNVDSLESVLGVKLRNRIDTQAGRFQIAGYAEWVYDFISDDIESTLSDGTVSVDTARIAPGEHLINTGIGLSWICTEYLDVGIGYDGRFNADYEEHTGSAMLEVRF